MRVKPLSLSRVSSAFCLGRVGRLPELFLQVCHVSLCVNVISASFHSQGAAAVFIGPGRYRPLSVLATVHMPV